MNQIFEKDESILELCQNEKEILGDLKIYISSLLQKLWEKPELIALIIEHININFLKAHLAPFFAYNFYENIFSDDCIEDNLIYVLTLLMQSEIKNLNDINQKDKFLIDTPCGIMFDEIYKKIEIQMYLNKITKNAIEYLEKNYSNTKLDYNLNKIINELNSSLLNEMNDNKKREEDFKQKYLAIFDESSLSKLIEENKNNKNLSEFLNNKLSIISKEKQKYLNKKFLYFCFEHNNSDKIINLYKSKFYIAIDFIEQIFTDILNEIRFIPTPIKKICRIISELINQKFPNINTIDKSIFISKFFFNKLLIPFLSNRNIFTFINDNTLYNLKVISQILQKYINGNLFNSGDSEFSFSPFNWYTIYNIDNIITLYQNMIKVQLPSYLDNLINNKLSPDYEYDYFNENQEKNVNMLSILYNIEQVKEIINAINNNKNIIFIGNKNSIIKKIIERLMLKNNIDLINEIINREKENLNKYKKIKNLKEKFKKEELTFSKPKIQYFIITQIKVNKKYEKILNINDKNYFSIKLNKESKENDEKIQLKNKLSYLLNNYKLLEKSDFNENEIDTTKKILNEIHLSLNFIGTNNYIELCAEYLLQTLKELPENYCNNILIELEKDIKESIKEKEIINLSDIFLGLKFQNRCEINYKKYMKSIDDYEKIIISRKIIKEYFIPIELKFKYENDQNDFFNIKESSFKERDKDKEDKIDKYEKSNKINLCLSIDDFIKHFPDFMKYQESNDINIFDIQNNLGIPEQINAYMNIIRDKLLTHNIKNLDEILDEIYDYIIEKIYVKCCPSKPYKEDKDLFKKCISLKWIQPHHLLHQSNKLFLVTKINDFSSYFLLLSQEKSLRKKLVILNNIYDSIDILNGFYELDKTTHADKIYSLLDYFIIKAKPLMLYSNLRFMELYRNGNNIIIEDHIATLKDSCAFILKMDYLDLIDITLEEFKKNCKESIKEN